MSLNRVYNITGTRICIYIERADHCYLLELLLQFEHSTAHRIDVHQDGKQTFERPQ